MKKEHEEPLVKNIYVVIKKLFLYNNKPFPLFESYYLYTGRIFIQKNGLLTKITYFALFKYLLKNINKIGSVFNFPIIPLFRYQAPYHQGVGAEV